jgi:23S rRNA (adenine2030-N6)-methyltransferase
VNYRHAFHAGNHADVFKHAALTLVLGRLLEKPQPFSVLDTHAGIGLYDLTADPAQRSPEYLEGAARLMGRELAAAPGYTRLLHEMNENAPSGGLTAYPGSPEIVRRLMRADDRLIACELHPADAAELKARYREDRRIAVHHRDGYEATGGLLPPTPRRGLVLIDPPFERTDETRRLVRALDAGLKRWPTGIFMAWHPAKDPAVGEALRAAAAAGGWPRALHVELIPYAEGEASLPGSGLLILNAPWKLDEALTALCRELVGVLGNGAGKWAAAWLSPP